MKEQLKLLIALQKLDSSIIAFSKTITTIPGKISAMEAPLKKAGLALEVQKKALEALEKKKKTQESRIEEIDEKVQKMKDRTSDIKDNKAYTAHLHEIEKAGEKRYSIEDEILVIMEQSEEQALALKKAEEALAVENANADAMRKELDEEVKEAEKELHTLKAKRSEFKDPLDKDLYENYMKLLEHSDGLAITKAEAEICTGCNMNIMPQLYLEIQKNDTIVTCPQCGRMLYYEEPPAE